MGISSIVYRPSSIVYRPESSVWVLAHAADKTTELAAAIIPVMILHGLHTDSTYHSPLRETFVKDIREDFSNLVHCNLA